MKKRGRKTSEIPHYNDYPTILQDYIKYKMVIENRTYKTVRQYIYKIAFFLRYTIYRQGDSETTDLCNTRIDDLDEEFFRSITRSDILEYLYYLKSARNNSTNTRYGVLESLKSLFKYLKNEKIIDENITESIELPNLEKSLPKYLTESESKNLLDCIDGDDYERDLCIIVVFLSCGLRLAELVNIDIPDIKGDILKIFGKGKKEREVILTPVCASTIRQYLRVRGNCERTIVSKNALFISRKTGRRLSERRVQQIVSNALKKAGLDGYSTHKLRHTMATLQYQNGVDIRTIQEELGHENLSTTQVYTHVGNNQIKEAAYKNPLANYQPRGRSTKIV